MQVRNSAGNGWIQSLQNFGQFSLVVVNDTIVVAEEKKKEGDAKLAAIMGDEIAIDPALRLVAEFPVECDVRLIKDGKEVNKAHGREYSFTPDGPGVYRLEGWLKVDSEDRPWIYTNPIYIRNR